MTNLDWFYKGRGFLVLSIFLITACGGNGNSDSEQEESQGNISYTIETKSGAGGSIATLSSLMNDDGTATLYVAAAGGFTIDTVTGCGGSLSSTRLPFGVPYITEVLTADCAIYATFRKLIVSSYAGEGGSIAMGTAFNEGRMNFQVVSDQGYYTSEVSGCGSSKLAGNLYFTEVIYADCTVYASFIALPPISPIPIIDRNWEKEEIIGTGDDRFTVKPQIAMDSYGNAMAVWEQWDGTRYNIWANRYSADGGWGSAELIQNNNINGAISPQIAMDINGNALAVWSQSDGVRSNIWANRYTAGIGWGRAELIEISNSVGGMFAGGTFSPQIAMDTNGNALAVWTQYDETRSNIWANRYVAGIGWSDAELIETENKGGVYNPQIALDVDGNGFAVWDQYDGTRYNVWVNRYVIGSGWGSAELIENNAIGWANSPQIAMDASGGAMMVWSQYDGVRLNVWASNYVAADGWSSAELIEAENAGHAFLEQIAMDAAGNAMVVWEQYDGTSKSIWFNQYVVGNGWGSAEPLEGTVEGNAYSPQIAMDTNGNALVVWLMDDGARYNIWANHYVVGVGWEGAEHIETDAEGDVSSPQIVINSNGDGLAVWYQSKDALANILASRFKN